MIMSDASYKSFGLYFTFKYMDVSLNGGTPKTPQNDHL